MPRTFRVSGVDFGEARVSNFILSLAQVDRTRELYNEFGNENVPTVFSSYHRKIVIKNVDEVSKMSLKKRKKNKPFLLVFPELSVPKESEWEFLKLSTRKEIYIVAGFEFTEDCRNVAKIFTPNSVVIEEEKRIKSKYDSNLLKPGNSIKIFRNTGIGDFAVLICLDLASLDIIYQIKGLVDFVIVVSYNPGVADFENFALTFSKTHFSFFAICNVNVFGRSAVYAPTKNCRITAYRRNGVAVPFERQIKTAEINVEGRRTELETPGSTGDNFYDHSFFTNEELDAGQNGKAVNMNSYDILNNYELLLLGVAIGQLIKADDSRVEWKTELEKLRLLNNLSSAKKKGYKLSSEEVHKNIKLNPRNGKVLISKMLKSGQIKEERAHYRVTNSGELHFSKKIIQIANFMNKGFQDFYQGYKDILTDKIFSKEEIPPLLNKAHELILHLQHLANRFGVQEQKIQSDIDFLFRMELNIARLMKQ